jgi:hypothetical protein
MKRALVVEPTDGSETLVREAGELAAGVGAELVHLHVTTVEEGESNREQLSNITNFENQYGIEQTREGARQFAENIGEEVSDPTYRDRMSKRRIRDSLLDFRGNLLRLGLRRSQRALTRPNSLPLILPTESQSPKSGKFKKPASLPSHVLFRLSNQSRISKHVALSS